jgi:5-formyltetrahydrofolate cyclo-ligase
MIQRRLALPEAVRNHAAQAVALALAPHIAPGACVAGYVAINHELDAMPVLLQLAGKGHALALPVVEQKGQPLQFRRWQPGEALGLGHYNIPVPQNAQTVVPDVVLVPLLAVDETGHRLGYGGGFYDRTLHACRKINSHLLAYGLAYDFQCVARLPAEPHDVRLDAVITEKGIRFFHE